MDAQADMSHRLAHMSKGSFFFFFCFFFFFLFFFLSHFLTLTVSLNFKTSGRASHSMIAEAYTFYRRFMSKLNVIILTTGKDRPEHTV